MLARFLKTFILGVSLLVSYTSPGATTYYTALAANGGSNANTGLTTNSPWLITKGISYLTNGNTVYVWPGEYVLGTYLDISYKTNGTANRASLVSYVPHKAIIKSSPNIGIGLTYCYGIVVDGFTIQSNMTYGIIGAFWDCVIKNCRIEWNGFEGIAGNSGGLLNYSNTIERCYVAYNGERTNTSNIYGHGIYITGQNNILRNNLCWSNWGANIHMYSGSAGTYMTNNYYYGNITYGHHNGSVGLKSYQRGAVLYGSLYDGTLAGYSYVYNNTFLDGISLSGGTWYGTNNIILGGFQDGAIIYTNTTPLNVTNLFDYTFSTNTVNGPGTHNIVSLNTPITTLFPKLLTHGQAWLQASSPATVSGVAMTLAKDWWDNTNSTHYNMGAVDYNVNLDSDIRLLNAMPLEYWATGILTTPSGFPAFPDLGNIPSDYMLDCVPKYLP